MFNSGFKSVFACFLIIQTVCLPQLSFAEDRSALFETFEIEGTSVGLIFSDAVAKAESRGYRLVNASARDLTKKEDDGSTKSLIFDMPFIENEYPQLKVVWRIAYQKKFPQNLSFEPDSVMASLKEKYGTPDKDYQDRQGRHTIIYYRDASKKAEIRFEALKTWRDQVLNVSMSDVNMKVAGRAAYTEAKAAKANAQQQALPSAVIDY